MRIYVGNLSFQATEQEVRDLFAAHGQVDSVEIVKDRYSGASRGFGFVEMASQSEGEAAIAALNGTEHQGRSLNINEARPRPEGSRGGPRRRSS